jgi:hypothetical protein
VAIQKNVLYPNDKDKSKDKLESFDKVEEVQPKQKCQTWVIIAMIFPVLITLIFQILRGSPGHVSLAGIKFCGDVGWILFGLNCIVLIILTIIP